MIISIILALLLLVIIGSGVVFFVTNDPETQFGSAATGIVVTVIFAITFVLATFVVVSTRNIGVVTTFGRPVGTLSNGLHYTWPWQSVTELDGSIQIDWHKDGDGGDGHGDAIVVRLGNNSNAWTDTSVRWEMQLDAADDLFLQYKTFDNIRTNLVTRNLQTALNEVFASYNPLGSVNPADPNVTTPSSTKSMLPELAAKATEIMQKKVGNQIKVFEVQIPTISFDPETQGKIDQLNQQRAATAVAIESQKTATEQARANDNIAASLQDPNVLVSKCLDVVKEKGGSPLGCWPNSVDGPVLTVPKP